MDFPIAEFRDEDACYGKIIEILHPDGLACHGADQTARPDPVVEADELSHNAGE